MKFHAYLSDAELNNLQDEDYPFSQGKICLINDITYLAIFASYLNKNRVFYALFEWKEQDFKDKDNCINNAEAITKSVLSFAANTIDCVMNSVMPFAQKKNIQSIFAINQCSPFPNFCDTTDELNISMEETSNLNEEHAWTIKIQDNNILTLNNKNSAKTVFDGLVKSICKYVEIWIKSMQ